MGIAQALCSILLLTLSFQESALLDKARRHGGRASNELEVTLPVGQLEQLVPRSSLIVFGRVQAVSTQLLESGEYVVTEWSVVPVKTYKGRLQAMKMPGTSETLVVRRLGGTASVDGLEVTTKVPIFPEDESLRVGEDVVLFLVKSDSRPDAFDIMGGPFGVFRVRQGEVTAMTEAAAQRRGDSGPLDLVGFEQQLAELMQ